MSRGYLFHPNSTASYRARTAKETIDRLTEEVKELRDENTRLRRAIDLVEATIEAVRQ